MANSNQVTQVLDFWFSARIKAHWFLPNKDIDDEIRSRYSVLYNDLVQGAWREWLDGPDAALAAILALDQFPRNLFRGQVRAYASDAFARSLANQAIAKAYDRHLVRERLPFMYLPFMHSESLADQDRSVQLFSEAGLDDNLKYALHHRDIVLRFGRFPHRNVIIGRQSRPEELEWLASDSAFKG